MPRIEGGGAKKPQPGFEGEGKNINLLVSRKRPKKPPTKKNHNRAYKA